VAVLDGVPGLLVGTTMKFVDALQVPGVGAEGGDIPHRMVGSTMVRLLPQLHRRAELLRADLSSRRQPRFDVRQTFEEANESRSGVDAEREEGAGEAGAVAEEGDPSVGRLRLFAEVGGEASVERRRVHVADVGGDQEGGLRLRFEVRFALSHEGLLDVTVEVRLGQVFDWRQRGQIWKPGAPLLFRRVHKVVEGESGKRLLDQLAERRVEEDGIKLIQTHIPRLKQQHQND
jgi:hypothetical protein